MISRATGLFTIYRGTTTNDSGDEIDGAYIAASGVPLALRNEGTASEGLNTDTPRQITRLAGRATSGADLRARDRIKDEATGEYFQVDWIVAPLSSTRNSDLQFGAHRVS